MNKELAENYLQGTLRLKAELEKNFLTLGERLKRIRDERIYLSTHTSFVEFLWEAKMTESTASKLINVFTQFVETLNLNEDRILEAGGWTTVYKLKDLCIDRESADEWLDKARDLSPKDLDIVIREAKTGIVQAECEHRDMVKMNYCPDCHQKTKIYPDEKDHIHD